MRYLIKVDRIVTNVIWMGFGYVLLFEYPKINLKKLKYCN